MLPAAREQVLRLVKASCCLAVVSLSLLIVNVTVQITLGQISAFTSAVHILTIGILSGTATLIGKALRTLLSVKAA